VRNPTEFQFVKGLSSLNVQQEHFIHARSGAYSDMRYLINVQLQDKMDKNCPKVAITRPFYTNHFTRKMSRFLTNLSVEDEKILALLGSVE